MGENYAEDFRMPEFVNVDITCYRNLQENEEYYKAFTSMVESEVDFFDEKNDDAIEVIDNIKEYLNQLRKVLH